MNTRSIIETKNAPAAIGPYSQAVRTGNLLFTSGQIPLDPGTGELAPGGITEQAVQVFENLKAVLEAAGSSLEQVVKFTCFITDMGNFAAVNEVFSRYLSGEFPARSCVEVSALPRGVSVEIEAVAYCQ